MPLLSLSLSTPILHFLYIDLNLTTGLKFIFNKKKYITNYLINLFLHLINSYQITEIKPILIEINN